MKQYTTISKQNMAKMKWQIKIALKDRHDIYGVDVKMSFKQMAFLFLTLKYWKPTQENCSIYNARLFETEYSVVDSLINVFQ